MHDVCFWPTATVLKMTSASGQKSRSLFVLDGRAQAILSRMGEPEDVVFGDRATAIMWSPDIVSFMRGASTDHELGIRNAADALSMTLRVWLAGPASNDPHGSV
jgi:hypothetical protein